MRISEVASRTGLNVSNVRFYERKGLLTPVREAESKYRDYTEEDIKRIKQILLYRKMGVSIETIYLLLNGQADMRSVLLRQKDELQLQMENLQGAIDLCGLMLKENQIDDDKLDQYLNYVHAEEAQGKQFAEIKELMEDIVDYSMETVFYGRPEMVLLFRRPWIAGLFSVVFWVLAFAFPVSHLINVYLGKAELKISILAVYGIIMLVYLVGFQKYRKARRRYLAERG